MTNVFSILVGALLILAGFGEHSGALAGAGCIVLAIGLAADSIRGSITKAGKATETIEKALRDLEAQARWLNEYTMIRERRENPGASQPEREAQAGAQATTRQQEKTE